MSSVLSQATAVSSVLSQATQDLTRRECARVAAATGLVFQRLGELVPSRPLSEVTSSRGGVWGDDATDGSGYPVLRSTNMRGSRVDVINPAWCTVPPPQAAECELQTGDILVTKSSGSSDLVGKAALFEHPGDGLQYLFSNFTLRLRPDRRCMLPEFLAWFLRSPQSLAWRYDAQQNAVGLRNLQTKAFLSQYLPVPDLTLQQIIVQYFDEVEEGHGAIAGYSLPYEFREQRRIAARIEELATRIEEAKGLRREAAAETEALMPSVMINLFGARELEYTNAKLESVVQQISDINHSMPKAVENGVKLVSPKDFTEDGIDFRHCKHISRSDFDLLRAKIQPRQGDILFSRIGTIGQARLRSV